MACNRIAVEIKRRLLLNDVPGSQALVIRYGDKNKGRVRDDVRTWTFPDIVMPVNKD